MNKTITIAATLLSASLFSGIASANGFGQDVEGDILHGNGAVAASPVTPYVTPDTQQDGIQTDLLSNRHEFDNASQYEPYQIVGSDRDNRDDLRDQVS